MQLPIRFALFVLLGVSSLGAALDIGITSSRIDGIPHVRQKPDFCGEACIEMWLRKLGHTITQDDVFNVAKLDPALGRGCYAKELTTAARALGFNVGKVWYPIRKNTWDIDQQFAALMSDAALDIPSIVCMKYNVDPKSTDHFRLIIGFDAKTSEVIYHEPAEDNGAYRRMSMARFLRTWPLKDGRGGKMVIRMPLRPKQIITPKRTAGFTDADYAQHIHALRKTLPGHFTVVLEKPFVVIGDEKPDVVKQRAVHTVRWSVDRLKKQYFTKDPTHIINVWLFRDKRSYVKNSKRFFKITPHTPYGFYSKTHRALVMNIATGGGTLVHEIVHPFVAANFPKCPAWFNEGLGSLYEQSSSRGRKIVGLTNWRLAGLQQAIQAGRVPSFETLCSTTDHQFYQQDPGTNYAQARYLCYYLQEKGLLHRYYHSFVKNAATDPTGYNTLKQVLGREDMRAFKVEWERYVLGLRFP